MLNRVREFRKSRVNSLRFFIAVNIGRLLVGKKKYFWLFLPLILLARFSKSYYDFGLKGYRYQFKNFLSLIFHRKLREAKFKEYKLNLEDNVRKNGVWNEVHFEPQSIEQIENSQSSKEKTKLLIFVLPSWWKSYLTTRTFKENVELLSKQSLYELRIIKADSFYQNQASELLFKVEGSELIKMIDESRHSSVVLFFVGLKYFPNTAVQTFLEQLREDKRISFVCYLPDIWQNSYFDIIRKFDHVFEEYWVYEIPGKLPKNLTNRIKLVLFPRFSDFTSSLLTTNARLECTSGYELYFRGNFYFGRWTYLFFLTRLSRRDTELLSIEGSFGKWSGSTENYLKELLTPNLATLNFLERDPGNFTLTERVWDSFASRGLVIAHVGLQTDPISAFFKPNVDYLPFRNLTELSFIFQMIVERAEILDKVRYNGYRKFKQQYSMGNLFELLE